MTLVGSPEPERAELPRSNSDVSAGIKAEHISWIDAARGLGIVLVVIGHAAADAADAWAQRLHDVIYIFHMPLFFVLVGVLTRVRPPLAFARHRLLSLMLPYFSYLVLIGVPVALATHAAHGRPAWKEFALYLYGGQHLVTWMAVFWFVPCLAVSQIFFNALLSRGLGYAQLAITITLCYGLAYLLPAVPFPMPLGILTVPMAVVFIWAGYVLRRYIPNSRDKALAPIISLAAVVGSCAALTMVIGPLHVDMKNGVYGPPVFGSVISLSSVALVLLLVMRLEKFWTGMGLTYLGRSSLTIMFLSEPVRRLSQNSVGVGLSILAAIAVPLLVHMVFARWSLTRILFLGRFRTPDLESSPKRTAC